MTSPAGECGAASLPPLAVLTRPEDRNDTLAQRLRQAGRDVLVLPALRIEPLEPERLPHPRDFDLVVLVSGNAVRHYLSQCLVRDTGFKWPRDTAAAVVGPGSAAALQSAPEWNGAATLLRPAADAPSYDSESLWTSIQQQGFAARKVLVVRGNVGRDWLADWLAAQGAQVEKLALYRRTPRKWGPDDIEALRAAARDGRPVHWLLTSAEGLQAVCDQAAKAGLAQWLVRCAAVATHERIAAMWRQNAADTIRNDAPCEPMVKISLPEDEALARCFLAM